MGIADGNASETDMVTKDGEKSEDTFAFVLEQMQK